MIIGKLGFGKDDFYYGLELSLHKAGRTAYEVTPATVHGCDVLLVTMFWFRDLYLLARFLREAGLRPGGRPYIIAGGMQATMIPRAVAPFVDAVFIGDADDHLGPILDQLEKGKRPESPYLYRHGDPRVPEPAECKPSAFAMEKGGRGEVVRIEIARGCRFSCSFCALTGLKRYREVPFGEIEPLLKKLRRRRVSLFAPEVTAHSEWNLFERAIDEYELRDSNADVRLEAIRKLKSQSRVTLGMEGISFRLRKLVGKPWKADFILDRLGWFVSTRTGIARVAVYFIADLPGESEEDWAELWDLFELISKQEWSRKLTLVPILNPFSPKPFTPLAGSVVHPFRDYDKRWKQFLRRGGEGQWGFRISEKIVWGPLDRTLDAIATNAGPVAHQVIKKIPTRLLSARAKRSKQAAIAHALLNECNRLGLSDEELRVDRSTGWPKSAEISLPPAKHNRLVTISA